MIGDGAKRLGPDAQIMAPAPSCCEQWPVCTCTRDSKILSLTNGPLGSVFQDPKEWDAVVLPGVSYGVMYVYDDKRIVVALALVDPPDADYTTITLERWQELCLQPDARLLDGSAHRSVCRPLARDAQEG